MGEALIDMCFKMNVVCIYFVCFPLIKVFWTTLCKLGLHLRIIMAERRCCLMMITRSKPRAKQSSHNVFHVFVSHNCTGRASKSKKEEEYFRILLLSELFCNSLCRKLS